MSTAWVPSGNSTRAATSSVGTATALYLFSFWVVMVPYGYYLGVVRGGGAPALMQAILVGCVVASFLLGWRFHTISRRAVTRA